MQGPSPPPLEGDHTGQQVAAVGSRNIAAGRDILFANTGDIQGDLQINIHAAPPLRSIAEHRQDLDGLALQLELAHYQGRDWLREQIEHLRGVDTTTIFLEADPGWGKSAFSLDLVKRGAVGIFSRLLNDRANRAEIISSFSAELAVLCGHSPTDQFDPSWGTTQGLRRLLGKAALRFEQTNGCRLLLILDGADELVNRDLGPLGLCPLPENVDLVVTYRTGWPPYAAGVDIDLIRLSIESSENIEDLSGYLSARFQSTRAKRRLAIAGLRPYEAQHLVMAAAQGLWIHAVLVLKEFLNGRGRDLRTIPKGLRYYYADLFTRTRDSQPSRWSGEILPVLAALGASREPATAGRLAVFANIPESTAHGVLASEWSAVTALMKRTGSVSKFAPYHGSLQRILDGEWERGEDPYARLAAEIAAASISAHSRAADHLLHELGGLQNGLPRLNDDAASWNEDILYALRHLAEHLQRAARTQDLFDLLTLQRQEEQPSESKDLRSVWADAQTKVGQPTAFLRDVRSCAYGAREAVAKELANGGPVRSLGAWLGASLVLMSLLAIARNTPPALLGRLVETECLSGAYAAELARAVPHATQRSESLSAVAAAVHAMDPVLARVLRVEAVSSAALWDQDKGFVDSVRHLVPFVPDEVRRATASRANAASSLDLLDLLDVSWRRRILEGDFAPSGKVHRDALELADKIIILSHYSNTDEDWSESIANAAAQLRSILGGVPEKYPVIRLACQAALEVVAHSKAPDILEQLEGLARRGLGIYVAGTAGSHLLAAYPESVASFLARYPEQVSFWRPLLPAAMEREIDAHERHIPEEMTPRVRGALEDFLSTGSLPRWRATLNTDAAIESPDGDGQYLNEAAAFAEAAFVARIDASRLLGLIAYVIAELPYRPDIFKKLVERGVTECVDETLDLVLLAEDTATRAIGLSILAPSLNAEETRVAYNGSSDLSDGPVVHRLAVSLHTLIPDEELRIGGSGCLTCMRSDGSHDPSRPFNQDKEQCVRAYSVAVELDDLVSQFGFTGRTRYIAEQLMSGAAPLIEGAEDASQALPDICSALMCLGEDWRAVGLAALHAIPRCLVPSPRLLALANSVQERPWRAVASAAAVSIATPLSEEDEVLAWALRKEALAVLLESDCWDEVDPFWRVQALEQLVPSLDLAERRQLLSGLSPNSQEYWTAARLAPDSLTIDEARSLLQRIRTSPQDDEMLGVLRRGEVLGSIAAKIPTEEWFGVVDLQPEELWHEVISTAVDQVDIEHLGRLLRYAQAYHDPGRSALSLSRIADAFSRRAPHHFAATVADAARIVGLQELDSRTWWYGVEAAALLGIQPKSEVLPDVAVDAIIRGCAWSEPIFGSLGRVLPERAPAEMSRFLIHAVSSLVDRDEHVTASTRRRLVQGLTSLLPTIAEVGGLEAVSSLARALAIADQRQGSASA
jgi:hypothetical protein